MSEHLSRAERRRAARIAGTPFTPTPRAPKSPSRGELRTMQSRANEQARLVVRATKFALAAGYIKPLGRPETAVAPPDPAQVELSITYAVDRAARDSGLFNRRELALIAEACQTKRERLAADALEAISRKAMQPTNDGLVESTAGLPPSDARASES